MPAGKTPKPLVAVSRVAFKANFLGKELAYIYEIKDMFWASIFEEYVRTAVSYGDNLSMAKD